MHRQQSPFEENRNNQTETIVLGVYIHCESCGDEVIKCLRKFEGIEDIEIDAKNHKVIVKSRKADPTKVADRLRKKKGKHVELISPKPKQEEKNDEKKSEPNVTEVVLKMYIHCEGCAKEVKDCIHKMEGVQTVDPRMAKNQVIVKGTMVPKKLVEFINKRSGRNAEVVRQISNTPPTNREEENQNLSFIHGYPDQELLYAPQLCLDKAEINPKSCSVM